MESLNPLLLSDTIFIAPKIRYAVHFPDHRNGHPGYLLVDSLSSGSYGDTMLILSLQDNKIYVRKVEHVRRFNPARLFQSDDVENAVYHANVPNLETWRDYVTGDVPTDHSTTERFVLSSSTWTFCNGGTLFDFYDSVEDAHDHDDSFRIPEACLWKFLQNIVNILTHIHRSGVAHGDTHDSNWFLHWPSQNSVLPDIYLGDFGLAQKFPVVNHQDFHLPFLGNLDPSTRPLPLNLSEKDLSDITGWYTVVRQDWRNGLNTIRTLLYLSDPHSLHFLGQQAATQRLRIDQAASTNTGLMGYSATLIAALSVIQKTTETHWNNPAALGSFLTKISDPLSKLASDSVRNYLTGPDRNSMNFLRLPLPRPAPATLKDPRQLLDFANNGVAEAPPVNLNLRLQSGPDHDMNELFARYRDGDHLISDRVMSLHHPRMRDGVRLRRREYRVARIRQDTDNPSNFQVLNFVNSLDECAPLSPDSPFDPNAGHSYLAPDFPLLHEHLFDIEDEDEDSKPNIKCKEPDSANNPPNALSEIPQHVSNPARHQALHNPVLHQPAAINWRGAQRLHITIPNAAHRPFQIRTQNSHTNVDVVLQLDQQEHANTAADTNMNM